jgi:8-oxo-dGTP diphosphatase
MPQGKKIGVHGLIQNDKGLYLVMKRSELDVDEGNCWDPVGGGIEDGETIEEGFKREVGEEADIEVADIKLIQAYTIDTGGLQLIVTAITHGEKVILSSEHNDYKWITFEELKTISPVSLYLKAVQYMLKNNVEVARYEDYK